MKFTTKTAADNEAPELRSDSPVYKVTEDADGQGFRVHVFSRRLLGAV